MTISTTPAAAAVTTTVASASTVTATTDSARATPVNLDMVWAALSTVDDPEYPGLSIVDLGLVEQVETTQGPDGSGVTIGLVPTFSGCPALHMIAADVIAAVANATGLATRVEWLSDPVWTTARMSPLAEQRLANEFTVVLRRKDGTLRCPVCGHDAVQDQSMAGPTRCRSIAWCPDCRNPIEVFRT